MGFYPVTTLSNLITLKDPKPSLEKSGLYRISCGDCNSQHIGQTGRTLSTGFREHRTSLTNNDKGSAFADHCKQSDHNFDRAKIELIHQCTKVSTMHRLEEAEIIRSKASGRNLLNDTSANFLNPFIRFYYNFQQRTISTFSESCFLTSVIILMMIGKVRSKPRLNASKR